MRSRTFHFTWPARLLILLWSIAAFGSLCFGQNNQPRGPRPPEIDLLTLSGSRPNLAPNGEGITSIKISDLYAIGKTEVNPFDASFKLELPAGYALFDNLAYMIDSKAVFSGPNDFVFKIPSATKESFDKLRILVAEYDEAEPQKPRWIDVTLLPESVQEWKSYLPTSEFEKRLPNFETRSLHGFMFERNRLLVVATKDADVARDRFVADLSLEVRSEPASVMVGRDIRYTFTVTNRGPDTATGVSFKSYVDAEFVSLKPSQGTCRWDAHNIYCNLGEIPKGSVASIDFHGKCTWNVFFDDRPGWSPELRTTPQIAAAEGDSNYENNQVFASAAVVKDPNKAPQVTIERPTRNQFFVGPTARINIVATASDPDGTIEDVEFFDERGSIGKPTLSGKGRYELNYANASYGQHFLAAVVTDNQGRPGSSESISVFVNGQAKVEVVSPAAKQVLKGPVGSIVVKVHASDPVRQIKKVEVHLGTYLGGLPQIATPTAVKDEYITSFTDAGAGTYEVFAVATDDAGVNTTTYPIQFRIAEPPGLNLSVIEDGYAKEIENGKTLSASRPIELQSSISYSNESRETRIVRFELFANDIVVCKRAISATSTSFDDRWLKCSWSPPSGRYTLIAVATDSDGETGKSTPVQVVVR